jgi:hypothetical protein
MSPFDATETWILESLQSGVPKSISELRESAEARAISEDSLRRAIWSLVVTGQIAFTPDRLLVLPDLTTVGSRS